LDLFPEFSYEELKEVMDKWLNPDAESAETVVPATSPADDDDVPFTAPTTPSVVTTSVKAVQSPSTVKAKGKDSVEQAFDDLFNS
jgi:hypothetical protein